MSDIVRAATRQAPPFDEAAEQAVLCAMLLDRAARGTAREQLVAEAFYREAHRRLFTAILAIEDRSGTPDVTVLVDELRRREELHAVGGIEYVSALLDATPTAANVTQHAAIVRRHAQRRAIIASAVAAIEAAYHEADPAEIVAQLSGEVLPFAVDDASGVGYQPINPWAVLDEIEQRMNGQALAFPSGIGPVDDATYGFRPGELVIIGGVPKAGKAMPLDTHILTPRGWRALGSLRAGEALVSIDGAPSEVEAYLPQGEQDEWEVTFSDGTVTRCCGDHLWRLEHRRWSRPRVAATSTIATMLRSTNYRRRLSVPCISGDFGHDDALPVHPYLLGVLIGDGSLSGRVHFTKPDDEVHRRVAAVLPGGVKLETWADARGLCRITGRRHAHNPVLDALRTLGLDCNSPERFIPAVYLHAAKAARRALLQGLLDTDGYTQGNGHVCYCTTSPQLAGDVRALVQSLGYLVHTHEKAPTFTHNGEAKDGRAAYVLSIRGDASLLELVTLPRHQAHLPRRTRRTPRRVIERVEKTGRRVAMACLRVTHPSRCFVVDDYVVTHNSMVAHQMAAHVASLGHPAGIVSAEMSAAQVTERLMAAASGVPLHVLASGRLTDWQVNRLTNGAAAIAKLPIHIDDAASPSLDDILARAVALKAKHPTLAVLVVDFLQLVRFPMKGRRGDEELTAIAYALKGLAKRTRTVVIAPAQLNYKDIEKRPDKRPQLQDLAGSSGMLQAADFAVLLFREKMYFKEAPDTLELIFGACRRTGPFTASVWWNGGTMSLGEAAPERPAQSSLGI